MIGLIGSLSENSQNEITPSEVHLAGVKLLNLNIILIYKKKDNNEKYQKVNFFFVFSENNL